MANEITIIRDHLPPDDNHTSVHPGDAGIVMGRWDGGPSGQAPCEIILNDPAVSRIHAGVNHIDGEFYLINLSMGNVLRLNSKWLKPEQADVLADGDVLRIGSYFLAVTRRRSNLTLRVFTQTQAQDPRRASSLSGSMSSMSASIAELLKQGEAPPVTASQADPTSQGVINVFWERRKKREKAARPSPLHPRTQPRPGKVRWNWQPTRDLARPWPFSVFIWATVLIAAFAIFAAYRFASAYSPAPLSSPHQRAQFVLTERGKIADKVNANGCLTCHVPLGRVTVDQKCAECHNKADGFHQSNTKKHIDAGITCTTCHQEHQGEDYQPKARAFDSCAECHNDNNPNLYGPNKEQVSTPHKNLLRSYGYPVKLGKWVWMGLEKEVLELKPDVMQVLQRYTRGRAITPQEELNWQFHYIHLERIKPVLDKNGKPLIGGLKDGAMSCFSCHSSLGAQLDRNMPIETCAKCHNGYYDELTKKQWVDEGKPNCTSCHVQHYYDKYRWGDLLLDKAEASRLKEMDAKTVESIIKPQP